MEKPQSSLISQPCQSEPEQNKNSSEAFKKYIKLFGKAFDKPWLIPLVEKALSAEPVPPEEQGYSSKSLLPMGRPRCLKMGVGGQAVKG